MKYEEIYKTKTILNYVFVVCFYSLLFIYALLLLLILINVKIIKNIAEKSFVVFFFRNLYFLLSVLSWGFEFEFGFWIWI